MFKCSYTTTDARLYLWIPQIWPIPPISPDFVPLFHSKILTLLGKFVSLPVPALKSHTYR